MKTLPFVALFITLLITSSHFSSVIASSTAKSYVAVNDFDYLRVHRQGNAVSLTWKASAINASEYIVERSYDGEFFEAVTIVHAEGSTAHKYKDENVFGGTIYYRITAVSTTGEQAQSAIESVRIVRRG